MTADATKAPHDTGHRIFPDEEYAERRRRVRESMREEGLDALLVTSPENIFYLAGLSHQGNFAFTLLLLPLEGRPLLVTRMMERMTVTKQVPDSEHVGFEDDEDPADAVVRVLGRTPRASSAIGVEKNTMSFPLVIWEQMQSKLSGVRWQDASRLIDEVRWVKSPAEIRYIRQTAALSDRAIRAGIKAAGVGVNEKEIAATVYHSMVLGGSEYPGFAPLIRSTDLLLQEHSTWQDRVLVPGDVLFMELSACVSRYHAPLTRLVHLGRAAPGTDEAARIALDGLEVIREHLRPGAISGDVYAAWQSHIDGALGHDRYRRHHCGYTVGIGFPPSWVGGSTVVGIRRGGKIPIREGMVFHLLSWLIGQEPTDYVVSDTALVTSDGCELLTSTQRSPIIVA